ncbi:MAG: hypothetical protein P8008_06705 [Gammaproteobacteria bacterium]
MHACLALGEALRGEGLVDSVMGLSLPLLENALRAVQGTSPEFARDVERAQLALRRLQAAFDRSMQGD